jgi:hypothetical protein
MPSLTLDEIRTFSVGTPTSAFVETGTYMGDTTHEASKLFKTVYSIELSPHYHACAKARFQSNPNIHLLEGDSSIVLGTLCPELNEPVFFWLDGHYSSGDTAKGAKDCPLVEELGHIMTKCTPPCVIAIDDVRLFGWHGTEDWSEISVAPIMSLVSARMESVKYFPSSYHPKDRMVIHLSALH